MKILVCHSYYRSVGGEDLSFDDEVRLLEQAGNDVVRFVRHNDELRDLGAWTAASRTLWNRTAYSELRAVLRRERPDVMHCTNTFPLLSPSVLYAGRAEQVPIVQAVRNYRMLCLNSFLCRDGRICESCIGASVPWAGIRHACYRDSRAASAVVAASQVVHRWLRTWDRQVDVFFTLTKFAREKLAEGGFPIDRIEVKPNLVAPDPGIGLGESGGAVFAGRLSSEKGLRTLLDAWRNLPDIPLRIIGEGPLERQVDREASELPNVTYVGYLPKERVLDAMGDASLVIVPSIWYETFGRTIIEAFAKGTPVIASRLGAMSELIEEGRTGRLFRPGDASDLSRQVRAAIDDRATLASMRRAARTTYERDYTAAANYAHLDRIYRKACGKSLVPYSDSAAQVLFESK
ncbi:MAG: glycosyltransferase [Planctomycetes bacterium]|nr:glycosyltransferase [Planctomycetota bacterium]